jgi:hypothetical protein
MAPTNFHGHAISGVPVGVLIPSCDGDAESVSTVSKVDDAQHDVSKDSAPGVAVVAWGANHNYFNRMWTPDQFSPGTCREHPESCVSKDDWESNRGHSDDSVCDTDQPGNGRLDSMQQRGFAQAMVAAFFRTHLLGATRFDRFLMGPTISSRPKGQPPTEDTASAR